MVFSAGGGDTRREILLRRPRPASQLIFPQFGPDGPLPNHGFARTSSWTFDGADDGRAVFSLEDSEATQKLWDHNFQLRLIVSLEPAGYTTSLQ